MLTIHDITISNFQRLTSAEQTFEGEHLIVVGGRNEQGKSSFLDALEFAFSKGAPSSMPIHEGAKRAEVTVTLCDEAGTLVYTVTKKATKSGQEITVKDAQGRVIPDAYALFADLTARGYGFDPIAFCEAGKTVPGRREQAETLRRLLGLDFTAHDAERKDRFNERTAVNAEVKRLEGQLSGLTHHPGAPAEELSLTDLTDSYEQATASHTAYQRALSRFQAKKDEINTQQAKVEEMRRLLALAEQTLETMRGELSALADEGKAAKAALTDLEPIKQAMATIEDTNKKVRENAQHAQVSADLQYHRADADRLTKCLEQMDADKAAQIAAAPLPIPELSVDDDEVLYQGRPLSVASTAGKLRVAVAIGIAMLKQLKVILIREGAALDSSNLRLIGEMAHAAGVQVFVERPVVRASTFVIEDGKIADPDTVAELIAAE